MLPDCRINVNKVLSLRILSRCFWVSFSSTTSSTACHGDTGNIKLRFQSQISYTLYKQTQSLSLNVLNISTQANRFFPSSRLSSFIAKIQSTKNMMIFSINFTSKLKEH